MNCKKTLVVALWAMFISFNTVAQKSNEQKLENEANALFKAGEYLKAYPLYSQLLSLYPADAVYNYKFGACAIYSDPDKTKAVKYLTIATNKALDDHWAWYYLGKAYHLNYQFKDAIKAYENFLRKVDPKVAAKTDAQRSIEACIYGSNLLANIKDIDVISKTDADKNNFFRYFNLEEVGGKILTVPAELQTSLDKKSKSTGVMHYPGNSTTIYFSSYGKDGSTGKDIYRAKVLPNGKFSTPEKIAGDVNTKYDEDYCFMHSNGKTLYFSSKGHNSMGGYDVFKSEYNPETDSFGPPVNMDFAINTPDDDIFYITDSLNQRAYFASGRSSDLNHLSVYNVMVQSTPLQVVYIKGDFFSEINNEQKNAAFKIIDPANNKVVCESKTNASTGSYILYVPRSGEYLFKITTENSPVVHEVKVEIPLFDRPVALHQEMRLIDDKGREKIVFRNHFDQPLEEDLSLLAAEMLRKKAGLDANVSADMLANQGGTIPSANAHALEPTMTNAPLAAGFAEGTTIATILSGMESELRQVQTFVAESDRKYINGFAYASKKFKEAEATLAKAEMLRKSVSGYTSDSDIIRLREAQLYTNQAELMQQEAIAAMNAAESVKQHKEGEAKRAQELDEQVRTLRQAESTQNFDAAVAALKEEKTRKNQIVNGTKETPFAVLMSEMSQKQKELQAAEQALSNMRVEEKSLEASVKAAQENLAAVTKNSDRKAAEDNYLNRKSELDKLRKSIVAQNVQIKKLGQETKIAQANAEVYKRLSSDTGMGLSTVESVELSDAEKNALTMKLNQMSHRIAALEITDPNTLALITDASLGGGNYTADYSNGNSTNNSNSVTLTATNEPVRLPNSTTSASLPAGGRATTNTQSSLPVFAAADLKSRSAQAVEKAGNNPSSVATRRMYLAGTLEQTQSQIKVLETKKKQGSLSASETAQYNELIQLRTELQQNLSHEIAAPATLSEVEFNTAVAEYLPNYTSDINVIAARGNHDLDRIAMRQSYVASALEQLKEARAQNAMKAMDASNPSDIASYTQRDKQLENAIAHLEKQQYPVNQLTTAYQAEQKKINAQSTSSADKEERMSSLTAQYINTLEKMEAECQLQIDGASDSNQAKDLRMQLTEIRAEKAKVATQLAQYDGKNHLAATVSSTTSTKSTHRSLEDELENQEQQLQTAQSTDAMGNPLKKEEQAKVDAVKAEKIFKTRVEAESIFAYESGIFEEIVAKHQSPENTLKNREKIGEINNQIFLLEGEMENVTSERTLRKLDYQAEQLYLRRSLIEIDNSPAIARMATIEYETQSATAKELTQANREKIDSRIMIRDEVATLERQAAENMEQAAEMRKLSPSIKDDIERADNDRQAFAKEALAIEQMRQIVEINNNLDMLLNYTDPNLAELKTGTVPKEFLTDQLAINVADEQVLSMDDHSQLPHLKSTEKSAADQISSSTSQVVLDNTQNLVGVSTEEKNGANPTTIQTQNNTTAQKSTTQSEQSLVAQSTNNQSNQGKESTTATPSAVNSVAENTGKSSQSSNSANTQPAVQTVSATPGATHASESTAGITSTAGKTNTKAAPVPSTVSNESMTMSSDYLFSAPKSLTADIFSRTNRAMYSASQPIPVDMEMPQGVYYKVQVGAFRNQIPQNLYDEFAPISGERLANGITRYTAGFFMNFENADAVKREIRAIGYGDAFVVAFRDGKRIPLYEAMGITEGQDMMAAVEKEYIYGDKGEAPKSQVSSAPKPATSSGSNAAKPKSNKGNNADRSNNGSIIYTVSNTGNNGGVSDYYAGFPEAAKATKVEATQGLFFTVQVGVYSRPVGAKSLQYINPLNSELTESKKIRYTSGMFTSMQEAVDKRTEARALGITDAFVTAYYNGQRISLSEADRLLKEKGNGILITKGIN